ncbi:helix-turn-helix domain-containing protein [Sebaldella sp. S0638]|uniref:winged helix-turn-helix transcriptional regulator n=1 Tax=Sebaldella sp. S0638 TaxID=2957809 RepID=UPI00209E7B2F|nr:helix-turn-helix domain-containing protein [Sebaldella sp. S0638]MCP1224306.1 helix-turn-helix transcriptional regulator [Sebaldella sp. S0638]
MYEDSKTCPVETTLLLINNKWKIRIIGSLLNGTRRFNEIRRILEDISQKVLTQNLREMERNGLVNREIYPEIPLKVEYSLTKLGYSLKPILDEMVEWGIKYEKNLLDK